MNASRVVSVIWIVLALAGYEASRYFRDAAACRTTRALPAQHRLHTGDLECDLPNSPAELTGLYLKTALNKPNKVTRDQLSALPNLTAGPGMAALVLSLAGRPDLARDLDAGSVATVTDASGATWALSVIAVSCSDRTDSKCAAVVGVPAALQSTLKDASKLTVIGAGK